MKMENNDEFNSIVNSKGQKSPNFKCKSFHINFAEFYEEENLSSPFEELIDNKDENDYVEYSFIPEYISFCEKKINETRPS
jgi:hypothetical protein